jgi:hypothetical protein
MQLGGVKMIRLEKVYCIWCHGKTLCPTWSKYKKERVYFKCTCRAVTGELNESVPQWDDTKYGKWYTRLKYEEMNPE